MMKLTKYSAKLEHFREIIRIYSARNNCHILQFALVGAFGTLLNLSLMMLLVEVFSTSHIYASCIATEVSIIHNFLLNNFWTFSSRNHTTSLAKRFLHFNLISIGTLVINVTVSAVLITMNIHYVLAQLCGIIAAFGINYLMNNFVVFAESNQAKGMLQRLP